ncbi:hypothetical protein SAMN02745121_01562 [Nannocystis exedens]|uniref:Uncharacterized protein n=1 Tax=Nannocystis exedens TaxID=54 RepID=A0A1I1V5C0_9BACT|nr:hypothetical protein NAEX_05439 [Nannocystis exedens]SFD78211.1 hypothetical protein SAMN02745121_01562 [Nannocystis exedens]
MMSTFPWQPSGATAPKSGGAAPLLLLPPTTASLVEVDVDTSVAVAVDVDVDEDVVLVDVPVDVLVVATSLLALPNGTPSGAAAWQPTKQRVVTTNPARRDIARYRIGHTAPALLVWHGEAQEWSRLNVCVRTTNCAGRRCRLEPSAARLKIEEEAPSEGRRSGQRPLVARKNRPTRPSFLRLPLRCPALQSWMGRHDSSRDERLAPSSSAASSLNSKRCLTGAPARGILEGSRSRAPQSPMGARIAPRRDLGRDILENAPYSGRADRRPHAALDLRFHEAPPRIGISLGRSASAHRSGRPIRHSCSRWSSQPHDSCWRTARRQARRRGSQRSRGETDAVRHRASPLRTMRPGRYSFGGTLGAIYSVACEGPCDPGVLAARCATRRWQPFFRLLPAIHSVARATSPMRSRAPPAFARKLCHSKEIHGFERLPPTILLRRHRRRFLQARKCRPSPSHIKPAQPVLLRALFLKICDGASARLTTSRAEQSHSLLRAHLPLSR